MHNGRQNASGRQSSGVHGCGGGSSGSHASPARPGSTAATPGTAAATTPSPVPRTFPATSHRVIGHGTTEPSDSTAARPRPQFPHA